MGPEFRIVQSELDGIFEMIAANGERNQCPRVGTKFPCGVPAGGRRDLNAGFSNTAGSLAPPITP